MNSNRPLLCQPELAADLARRLAVILGALAAVIARRFLRMPGRMALILPLWRWLTHAARRFERAALRPEVARRIRPARAAGKVRAAGGDVRLPSGHGWLVRELGWEAAGHGSQLAHLLAQPEMQALLAAAPGVGRVLRPLCRVLGLDPAPVARPGAVAAETAVAPKPRRVRAARAVVVAGVVGAGVVGAAPVSAWETEHRRPVDHWGGPRRAKRR